ncbi:MAG: IS4 family transposase [Sulfuricurvum sp.]|jgi:hypothetical protein|uniref:IS4 family transposase n=1 Tax=Sulfuricurvum sp. TaxID=2025608 RepID=UPI0025FA38F6|nr:IS4 family transposase [Sulfuricurvum sp.]MCK9372669.1 IS4 family transposase [Sulfuricurvum sp.]
MNAITKALKHQEKSALKKLQHKSFSTIESLIAKPELIETIQEELPNYRSRLYTPMQTLCMFISQALNSDRSCQNVVNEMALTTHQSVATGGYCKARQRLSETMVSKLTKAVAKRNEQRVKIRWRWQERTVYLVDGTTLTMPDTSANQESYPQTSALPKGLGFPICRVVGVISLSTGSLMDACVSPYHGKGASEQTLLRNMLGVFKRGDVVLADAFYSTYFLIEHMIAHGIDIVFVQHGARSRTTDFTSGTVMGENDHLITLKKPKLKPEWMTQNEYDSAPNKLTIRELKAGGKTLITTMLCPKKHPLKALGALYKQRWQIEVDLRNIKSTLGLKSLSCKTPQMAIKELWIYFLAYNLIRSIMLASAHQCSLLPREISFKHTLQLLSAFRNNCKITTKQLLRRIGEKYIGNRAGRVEPRAIKRRRNDYPLLMKLRDVAREEILKNGHPKKLK